MTIYELTVALAPTIRMLADVGITESHIHYVELYSEWLRLKKEGHKTMYVIAYLAERFDVSEANVWKWIKLMKREVEV